MIAIEKQVAFWRDGAQEDLTVTEELLERGRVRHGLFFLHLALEKILKAHVCRQTRDLAPRLHNLVRLAELAETHLPEWSDIDVLVVSPSFDAPYDHRTVDLLWRLSARVDSRIEPLPCGEQQWLEDDASAVVEIARRHGERISV